MAVDQGNNRDENSKARARLQGAQWSGLEQMFSEHAAAAIDVAAADFREQLGWQATSIERLEHILNRLCPAPEPLSAADSEWPVLLWGSYLGELLRHLHGGDWEMTLYPGSEFSVPTLVIGGSRVYPLMKVHRRLTAGVSESLPTFCTMLALRLGAAAPPGDSV